MAPERLLGVRDDQRSDLFSLGVLLYFFTTGERPFGESETLRGMKRRLWRDPYPPRKLKPELPTMAAGNSAALPGDRAGVAASDGFATGVRTWRPRTGQADGAVGAAQARSALLGVAPPLQSRSDAAAAEIRCRGPAGFGADRGRCDRYRGGVGRAQRMPAPGPPHSCSRHCRRHGSPA